MSRKRKKIPKVVGTKKRGKGKERKPKGKEKPGEEEKTPEEMEINLFKLEGLKSTRSTVRNLETSKPEMEKPRSGRSRLNVAMLTEGLVDRQSLGEMISTRPKRNPPSSHRAASFKVEPIVSRRREALSLNVMEPAEEMEKGSENLLSTMRDLKSRRELDRNVKPAELKERTVMQVIEGGKEVFTEIEEKDPFFVWPRGTPYTSRSPQIIINVDGENLPTLEMLQIFLRDVYKELKGGQPGALPVEFIANEPRFPEIQGNIVTLDLSGESWEASLRNGKPVIERGTLDIVPKLKKTSQNMFTGELGFLVINLPSQWKHSVMKPDFDQKLASFLSASKSEGRLPPVLVTEPRISDSMDFWKQVSKYFGLKSSKSFLGKVDKVPRMEELYNSSIRREDWRRVTITERQDNESDEHYFIKGSIAEGFVYQCYRFYKEENPEASYDQFFREYILESDASWIETEEVTKEDNREEKRITDIVLEPEKRYEWLERGLRSFFSPELRKIPKKIFLEVETGRAEGAFNFRKIREKILKYTGEFDSLWIVLPPRLFFRGKKRAKMIQHLATQTASESPTLSVPIFGRRRCLGIKKVDSGYIDTVYR